MTRKGGATGSRCVRDPAARRKGSGVGGGQGAAEASSPMVLDVLIHQSFGDSCDT